MKGPCAKQRVVATIVAPDGETFIGENDCGNAQPVCPRADLPSGVGYHLCREICQQSSHAEIAALDKAGAKAKGAKLYLRGHNYICENCRVALEFSGVEETIILHGEPA